MGTVTQDVIKQKVAELGDRERRLFTLNNRKEDGSYQAGRLRPATIPAGYQSDGNWTVMEAPAGLVNTYVIAECQPHSQTAKFVEVFGKLPPAPPRRQEGRRR